jgi:hypothetical protein
MISVAWLLTWYKEMESRGAGSGPPKRPDADLAGGHV